MVWAVIGVIGLGVAFAGMLGYLAVLMRQVRGMNRQLEKRRREGSGQLVSLELMNGELSRLAGNLNLALREEEDLRAAGVREERRLKELIAGISHDLRTPLTAVKGYLQLLERSGLNREQREMLEIALGQAGALGLLLDRFFEYSWLEGREIAVNLERLNLTNLLADELVDFVAGFEERGLKVGFERTRPAFVQADLEMVKRIIGNLLRNCIAHSAGDVTAEIREDGEFYVLCLENRVEEAEGLNTETLFERYGKSSSGSGSVSGLGLSIVKMLAVQMGGYVGADLKGDSLTLTVALRK